jgi:DNA (cytosine-5)-methyltransferase 1
MGTVGETASWWATEPDVGRVAHGVPRRVDRLKGLGNAVVPQVSEWIGQKILEGETYER